MRVLLVSILSVLMAGCAMPTDGIIENRFAEITSERTPDELVGVWTGSNGPYLLTVRIKPDGTGLYCASWNERNTLGRIKIVQDIIHYQDGMKMVLSRDGGGMVGTYDYERISPVRFMRDDDLSEAAPYCVTALHGGGEK